MMSSNKNNENSSSRIKAISTTRPPAALNCPRCNSPNTKFCYYNNYSLTQPRHFCKTCKRYWTKGGALRNVPVGGGCRKNKKITARASSSRLSSGDFKDISGASSYSDTGGFKFFNGLEFQLGGGLTNFPRFNNISTTPPVGNQLVSSFGDIPTVPLSTSAISNFGLDPNSGNNLSQFMAFNNFPLPSSSSSSSVLKQDHADKFGGGLLHDMGMGPTNSNLASSIESLSSINQDLHWKLQQDRFNTMFSGGDNNNNQRQNGMISSTANYLESKTQTEKPQPVLFQNLEISPKPTDDSSIENTGNITAANLATEWCFGTSSYAPVVNQIPINSSGNGNSKEIQAWANFDQYTTLP